MNFEFKVDKENKNLNIIRGFNFDRELVWKCYTQKEYLEQWFAPKPLVAKTKSMDFSEDGYWIYAMVDPDGTEYWGRTDYLKIQAMEFYTALDGFSDSEGNINPEFPQAKWHVNFKKQGKNTIVATLISFDSLEDLEMVIKMGMEEGMKSTLEGLDEILKNI